MSLPYIIREENYCSYPLHPSANYRGEGWHRWLKKIPPDRHLVLLPSWYQFVPGEWRWCPRCTRRNAARITTVTRLADKAFTLRELARMRTPAGAHALRLALQSWGSNPKARLGGRFASFQAQTWYARRHAPPGMEWCSYGLHYSLVGAMAHVQIWRKHGFCEACYRRHIRGKQMRRLMRWQADQAGERQAFQALQQQRAVLRREIADLRRLKEAIAQDIATLPRQEHSRSVNENVARNSATIVEEDETSVPGVRPPHRVRQDRRKAYSV